jgi:hypothetical protein
MASVDIRESSGRDQVGSYLRGRFARDIGCWQDKHLRLLSETKVSLMTTSTRKDLCSSLPSVFGPYSLARQHSQNPDYWNHITDLAQTGTDGIQHGPLSVSQGI